MSNRDRLHFLHRDQDQIFDVSNPDNAGIWRTGGGWAGSRTITFIGSPPDDTIIELSNNSGFDQWLVNGEGAPLDVPLHPFRLPEGEYVQFATINKSSKLVKTLRAWETSSSRITNFGGLEGQWLGKISDKYSNFDWLDISHLPQETTISGDDFIIFFDTSTGRHKKMLVSAFRNAIL